MSIVYSTDPKFQYDQPEPEPETLAPAQQKLHVRIERSGRGGKTVTIVDNFIGTSDDLNALGKKLKASCGVGGSIKDGQILIQGDHRDRIVTLLNSLGYRVK